MTDWLLQINRCQHCFRNGMEFHFCVSLTATTGSTGVELHWNCCTWIQGMSAHLPAACAPSRSRTRMFWSRFCLVMRIAFSSSGAASVPANSWQFLLGTWFKCQWQVKFTQASLVTHWAKSQHVLKISSRVWSPTLTSFHSIPWEGISAWWKTCTTPYVLLWPSCESQTAPSWNKSKSMLVASIWLFRPWHSTNQVKLLLNKFNSMKIETWLGKLVELIISWSWDASISTHDASPNAKPSSLSILTNRCSD